MATSIYLSNPVVTVNGVSLTDQCTAASFLQRYDQLEDTAFGTGSSFVPSKFRSRRYRYTAADALDMLVVFENVS